MQGKFEEPVQKKNETGMPDNLKAGIEDLSGFAMDDVRGALQFGQTGHGTGTRLYTRYGHSCGSGTGTTLAP